MHSTPLSTFPPALARLLLCGGGGLPAAWGPLFDARGQRWPWDAARRHVLQYDDQPDGLIHWRSHPVHAPVDWAVDMTDGSPWPARMAVVAARMLGEPERIHGGCVYLDDLLNVEWLIEGERKRMFWNPATGEDCWNDRRGAFDLPTLLAHLAQHPPEVALLLALYDVPEIKARVEALQ